MDLLRAVIVGPAGTLYHDGLFFIDVHFPSRYPSQPPVRIILMSRASMIAFFFFVSIFKNMHANIYSTALSASELPLWRIAA